jgi:MoaD family protein
LEVTVRYFVTHRDAAGVHEERVTLPEGAIIRDLLEALYSSRPALRELDGDTMASVGGRFVQRDTSLSEGDEVSLLPPMSGG